MGLFAVFWLSFGVLQLPTLNLSLPYATAADPTGAASPAFNTDVGLYLVVWGFALFTFFVFTLRINAVFASIFGLVTAAAWVLAGACEFSSSPPPPPFERPLCFQESHYKNKNNKEKKFANRSFLVDRFQSSCRRLLDGRKTSNGKTSPFLPSRILS